VTPDAAPDCRCDHPAQAHEHGLAGTAADDCALCDCPGYRIPRADRALAGINLALLGFILLACLACFACLAGVWFGFAQPFLDAWLNR
jgi:hypothetical protein